MELVIDEHLIQRLSPKHMQALVRLNYQMHERNAESCSITEVALRQMGINWTTWASMRAHLLISPCYTESSDGFTLYRHRDAQELATQLDLITVSADDAPASDYSVALWVEVFDTHIWPHVWKRSEKKDALLQWQKLAPQTGGEARELLVEIIEGMERYKQHLDHNTDWLKPKSFFRWLKSERWRDEYEESIGNNGVLARVATAQQRDIESYPPPEKRIPQ